MRQDVNRLPVATCAVCVAYGPVIREPLGKDDALVNVCLDCATKEVEDPCTPRFGLIRRDPSDARAAKIREHRDRLKAGGICVNGVTHGKATHGVLCEHCASRARVRDARHREKNALARKRSA